MSFVTLILLSMHQRNAQATNRSWNEPDDTESGLPLTNDFKHKQQMELERNQEYNEFMKKVLIVTCFHLENYDQFCCVLLQKKLSRFFRNCYAFQN